MAYDQVKQYLEDDAHTTADKGMQVLAVRDDTLNARSGTENDYEPLHTNADGALWTLDVNSAAIKTAVETLDNAIAGSEMQVDIVSSALPSGASTSAKQDTIIGHLDGVEGLLTTIDSDTGTIATEVAGLLTDTELRATPVPVSGTVAVTGVSTLAEQQTQTTALQLLDDVVYAEDSPHTTADKGILFLGVRNANETSLSGTEGDYTPIRVDGAGNVYVRVEDSSDTLSVFNAGLTELAAAINSDKLDVNIASSAISFGGTSAADDADFTVGTTLGTPVMGVYDSTPDTVTDGDLGTIGINSTRAVRTVIEAGSASIGVVDLGATDNGVLDAIAASVASSDTSLTDIEAALETAGGLVVNLGANNDVTVTGTVDLGATDNAVLDAIAASVAAIDTDTSTIITNTGATTTALQIMDDWDNGASDGASVSGDVAHDTGDAGEPVKIGMKAYELDGTAPQTAVAEADRVNAIGDLVGRQYVATEHPRFFHVSADYASAQTNASVKASPGAGLAIYITDIMISNGATAGNITLLDGSGGTVLFELYPAINGGVSLNLKNPIKLTDATALCITSTTVTTHSIFVSGFVD